MLAYCEKIADFYNCVIPHSSAFSCKSMTRQFRESKRLSYQSLEPRQMLAGNIYASLSQGNLTVVGNQESNAFSINLNATTPEVLVQVQNGTSVRFANSLADGFAAGEIQNIYVFSNGGDDTVTIDGRSNRPYGELVVSLGNGNDSLNMTGGVFAGNATVYAGANHDSVFIHDTAFRSDLALIKGAGTDVSIVDSIRVTGQTRYLGQDGHDSMLVRNSIFNDSVFAEMGDGADCYESIGADHRGRLSVRGRIGYDSSMLDSSNSFAVTPNLQTIEVESLTPNANGKLDDAIRQVKAPFFAAGPEIRAFTASEIQASMAAFAADFGVDMIELDLDEASQYVSVQDATPTVSAIWDKAVQEAVIAASPGPTIASRAYAIMHTAMFDAWSAYDQTATSTVLGDTLQRPQSENTDLNKSVAMSFAAYRVLEDLFADQTASFDAVMQQLGFNPANQNVDATPAGIGNQMAAAILEYRHEDGSNQLGDDPSGQLGVPYSDISGYSPVNVAGDSTDIESWTPEFVPIDANSATADRVQQFLTPHWGDVETFSMISGSQFRPVAPEPFLLVDGTVNLSLGTITLANGNTVNIDKSLIGTVINPEFIAQTEEVVEYSANLDDEDKLIAEFWEDGGGTSFPPGTFMTFGQLISARDDNNIDDDAKMFFALGNAVFDAGIATWEAKTYHDYARPVRVVRDMGRLGLIGEFDSALGGYAIDAWSPNGGTQRILATDFLTYQTPGGDPSPPFAEYTSGHSAFSAAGATVLRLFTGSDDFGASVTFPAGSSRFEPGITPASDLTLSWDTFTEAADEGGISRLYGGIHFTDGDVNGRSLGDAVGQSAFDRAQEYIDGTA